MIDQYQLALGHLRAAMAAMTQRGDALAMAAIAQAIGIVDRAAPSGGDEGRAADQPGDQPVANRRPC